VIIEGDGTWNKMINEGRCPRCFSMINEENKWFVCDVCSLQINNKNPDMDWSFAVAEIEKLIIEKIDYMMDHPDKYDLNDIKKVEASWKRILRG